MMMLYPFKITSRFVVNDQNLNNRLQILENLSSIPNSFPVFFSSRLDSIFYLDSREFIVESDCPQGPHLCGQTAACLFFQHEIFLSGTAVCFHIGAVEIASN